LLGRKRREERRFDREAARYQMRQRMFSIGDDYTIENDRGEHVFKLDGKALRARKTILFKDMDGRELVKIQERMLHVRDSMEIEGPDGKRVAIERDGDRVAEVSKRWFRVRDTYGVEVAPGENDILILATTAVIDTMAHPAR